MGKIRFRQRNGIWYADFDYIDQSGKQRRFNRSTGKGTSRKEADAIARKWRKQARQLGYVPGFEMKREVFENKADENLKFSGYADHFMRTYAVPRNKPSEVQGKESVIRVHLAPFFADQDIRTIRREQIDILIAEKVAAGLAPSTVNNIYAVLSKMFNMALDWEYINQNPMRGIKKLKVPELDFDFYNELETEAFLESCEAVRPDWYAFFVTAFGTGMRLGELCGLLWDDLDFVSGTIKVTHNLVNGEMGTPKGGKNRIIPMHEKLQDALESHKHLASKHVFCRSDGEPLTRNTMRKPFTRITRKAGLRKIRLHDIRHSFASQLAIKGVSLKAVQELLGHSDISQTMRYAHLSPNVHQDAIQTLFGGSQVGSNGQPLKLVK